VVHFSGHGTSQGVVLESDAGEAVVVPKAALGDLFGILQDEIQCVVFNACYSEGQAQAVGKHVGAVVGTTDSITDEGAVAFAAGFYRGVSYGRTVRECFELGRNEVGLGRFPDKDLFRLDGADEAVNVPIRAEADEGTSSTSGIMFDVAHRQKDWHGIPGPTPTTGFRRFSAIATEDREVTTLDEGPLTDEVLQGVECVVLSVAPMDGTRLQGGELEALDRYVGQGGGVLILGAYSADQHHGANLNEFLASYGLGHGNDVLGPPELHDPADFEKRAKLATSWGPNNLDLVVTAQIRGGPDEESANRSAIRSALGRDLNQVASVSPCSIDVDASRALMIVSDRFRVAIPEYREPGLPAIDRYHDQGIQQRALVGASVYGKVVAVGSWKTFLDDFLHDNRYANEQLLRNILDWLCS
jgi:hypothetical protein